ncbi:kinase binding protein CGI-121-domain-containing protein [Apodospora peruviana]|uniref:EKC/KEOPS complex subunit CGI121 n=1 Tax=Apodospora peruviana TaxID=516989 RepID=A0AAE0MDP1_9PEZI|nr:kinase binding protein CGI-121-domain-containing protein [Apodospora peruviana]
MALEKLTIDNTPSNQNIYLALFRDVDADTTQALQKQLLARNPAFEYAFIDASSIISRVHLLSAIYNALNAVATNTLQTPNVHSEIVLSLSPSNNIADAYRRWGFAAGKTTDLIVVKVVFHDNEQTEEQVWAHLKEHIPTGTVVDPITDEEIAKSTDWSKVRKYYKLNGVPALDRIKDDAEKKREMERLAVMGMALRGL